MSGGGQISFEKPVLIEEQLRHLAEKLEANNTELAAIATETQTIQATLLAMSDEKKALDLEQQKLEVQQEWMEGQLNTKRSEFAFLEKEINLNRNDIATRANEGKMLQEQMQTAADSLIRIETEEQAMKARQQELEAAIQQQRDEENHVTPLLTEAKVTWATQASEIAGREREEERLKESIVALTQRLEQSRQELSVIDNRIAEQKYIQENETNRLQELYREQETKEQSVQTSLTERQLLMQQLEHNTTMLHNLRMQTEEMKQQIYRLQIDQRSHELQKQNMEKRLAEEFQLQLQDVKEECMKVDVQEEEIVRLRRRIESMGHVNLTAPEEYASLEERYNFLLTQQQDLLKAKDDLHQVMAKINQTTKENFKLTYDKVRENFRNLYLQLFEGGEADLVLTDENNLLECGVEIFAQPPGKKLQSIGLLSGGEKALTAISLLFAFFMVRPSPFCILDEVDAPLDEANVGRFVEIVKKFSDNTQFLVITHNKRTMEMANVLYGVTMEELGISKMISVRLNKELAEKA
jgi:chromosome segregation protein